MKMLFKQRLFSWFDSYDIYDESHQVLYTVKGQLSWGHCMKIYDAFGNEVGTVKEKIFRLLPQFEIYEGARYAGCISKEFSLFKPQYNIDYNGWHIDGSFMEWDYTIRDRMGNVVANIYKELFHMTDTYVINVTDESNALGTLMFVLAIDAEKCSRN
ncbi:MAG: LURP-one-related family protein [Eubacterium sp.]|nr:LURP-one-related family protein [Eubacterium sp.]MCI5937066.1 LURP-one-related family protein [Eubacterium sp.]